MWSCLTTSRPGSLADLFGRVHHRVPVYGGFTTYPDAQLVDQLTGWVQGQSIPRVKIKIGEDTGRREHRDLARTERAGDVIGPDTELFVDANGAYQWKQAVRVLQRAAGSNITWFEEPVSSDDLAGLRFVRGDPAGGSVEPSAGRIGHGLELRADAAEMYRTAAH